MRKLFAASAIAALMTTGGIGLAQAKAGDPGSNGNRGLCNAYQRGSDQGQAQKRAHGQSFLRLAETAGDYNQDGQRTPDDVIQYCADNVPQVGGGNQ